MTSPSTATAGEDTEFGYRVQVRRAGCSCPCARRSPGTRGAGGMDARTSVARCACRPKDSHTSSPSPGSDRPRRPSDTPCRAMSSRLPAVPNRSSASFGPPTPCWPARMSTSRCTSTRSATTFGLGCRAATKATRACGWTPAPLPSKRSRPPHCTCSCRPAPRSVPGALNRLEAALGDAATARVIPDHDGRTITMTRAWALHRARRAGGSPAHYGDTRSLPLRVLRPARPVRSRGRAGAGPNPGHHGAAIAALARMRAEARHVRGWRSGWRFLRWLLLGARWRLRQGRGRPSPLAGGRLRTGGQRPDTHARAVSEPPRPDNGTGGATDER